MRLLNSPCSPGRGQASDIATTIAAASPKSETQREEDLPTQDGVPPYVYEALHEKGEWIRVLQLRATPSRIECYIKQVNYTHCNFEALSYVWGSKDVIQKAFVINPSSGQAIGYIPLTTNLYSALRGLRDSPDISTNVFWIDQICINQSVLEEKNHQVAMMGRIYSHASRVITYVGLGEDDDQKEEMGLQLIRRLHEHFAPNYPYFAQRALLDLWNNISVLPVVDLPSDLAKEDPQNFWRWRWLVEVIALGDWATRLWIVQEQLLNANIVILRGRRILSWDSVALIATLFWVYLLPPLAFYEVWEEKRDQSLESDPASPWDFPYALTDFWKTRQKLAGRQEGASTTTHTRTLIENMYSFDALRCQDPRDRIYALLAISRDSEKLDIIPDYTISTEDVFHDVSVRMLSSADDLKLLKYVCWWDNNATPDQPSWAINSARPPTEMAYWTTEMSSLSTHPRATTVIKFNKDHRTLIIRGRIVDAIRFGSPPNYTNGSVDLEIRDFKSARFYLLLLSSWARILLDERPLHDANSVFALCRCLLPDPQWCPEPRNGRSPDQERMYFFLCTWRTLFRLEITPHLHAFEKPAEVQTLKDVIQVMHILEGMYDDRSGAFTVQEQIEKDGLAFYNSMLKVGRSFGKTSSGRVYSSMHEVADGDVVVALEGSDDRLWKLRPVDGSRYKLVGDIYVDGYMEGELYRDHSPEDLDVPLQIV